MPGRLSPGIRHGTVLAPVEQVLILVDDGQDAREVVSLFEDRASGPVSARGGASMTRTGIPPPSGPRHKHRHQPLTEADMGPEAAARSLAGSPAAR